MNSTSPSDKRHGVLIVDDHPIVRQGLASVLNREPDMHSCGQAADVAEAIRLAEETRPDAVIVDLVLADGCSGIDLIDNLKSRWPAVAVLVYSAHDEELFAGRVLRAGALGYVSKSEPITKVVDALRQVLRGEVHVSRHVAGVLLQRAAVGQSLDRSPAEALSDRELQVFELIGQGLNTGEIARRIELSPKTIESYRRVIKVKLNLRTSAQLSRRAFQWMHEKG